jgi:hypothetical protein
MKTKKKYTSPKTLMEMFELRQKTLIWMPTCARLDITYRCRIDGQVKEHYRQTHQPRRFQNTRTIQDGGRHLSNQRSLALYAAALSGW